MTNEKVESAKWAMDLGNPRLHLVETATKREIKRTTNESGTNQTIPLSVKHLVLERCFPPKNRTRFGSRHGGEGPSSLDNITQLRCLGKGGVELHGTPECVPVQNLIPHVSEFKRMGAKKLMSKVRAPRSEDPHLHCKFLRMVSVRWELANFLGMQTHWLKPHGMLLSSNAPIFIRRDSFSFDVLIDCCSNCDAMTADLVKETVQRLKRRALNMTLFLMTVGKEKHMNLNLWSFSSCVVPMTEREVSECQFGWMMKIGAGGFLTCVFCVSKKITWLTQLVLFLLWCHHSITHCTCDFSCLFPPQWKTLWMSMQQLLCVIDEMHELKLRHKQNVWKHTGKCTRNAASGNETRLSHAQASCMRKCSWSRACLHKKLCSWLSTHSISGVTWIHSSWHSHTNPSGEGDKNLADMFCLGNWVARSKLCDVPFGSSTNPWETNGTHTKQRDLLPCSASVELIAG